MFYDCMMADIEALKNGYWGRNENVIERKVERFFDRLDKAYMQNKITTQEYEELSFELAMVH